MYRILTGVTSDVGVLSTYLAEIFMAILFIFNHTFRLPLSSSGYGNAQLPGCFCPWTSSLNIRLNMLLSDSSMSCLHSLLGYFTEELRALQLIVLALFAAYTCLLYVGPLFWKSFLK